MVPERDHERKYFTLQEAYTDELMSHDETRASNFELSKKLRALIDDHKTEVYAWKDEHDKLVDAAVELNSKLLKSSSDKGTALLLDRLKRRCDQQEQATCAVLDAYDKIMESLQLQKRKIHMLKS